MASPGPFLKTATLALLVVVWGTTWAAIRISLHGFPPLTAVAIRFAIAGALLLLVARAMGTPLKPIHRADRWLRILHALCSFCISYGVVFWAEQWVPSGLASVLFATFPMLVVVLGHFTLPGERMTAPVIAGTVLGFAGIAVIFAEDFDLLGGERVLQAAMILLAAPLASAVAVIAVKRWGQGIHKVPFNASAMVIGAVVMAAVAAAAESGRPLEPEPWPALALLYLAVAGTALTFPLYFWLLEHMRARDLALINFGTPVVALFLGVVFLGEPLGPRVLAGSVLVLAGVILASRSSRLD
jgi:drug/metabolite transporter (DMT)-like permease